MNFCTNMQMVQLWVHHQDQLLLILSLVFMKNSGQNNVMRNLNRFIIDLQMIFLYYLDNEIIMLNLEIIQTNAFPISKFLLKKKKMESCFSQMQMSPEGNKFVTTVYHKHTFSYVYTHFDSLLPTTYKFRMIYILVFRYFFNLFQVE